MSGNAGKLEPYISDIVTNTKFEFKLEGWPASVVLITFCVSGVILYGINAWQKVELARI